MPPGIGMLIGWTGRQVLGPSLVILSVLPAALYLAIRRLGNRW